MESISVILFAIFAAFISIDAYIVIREAAKNFKGGGDADPTSFRQIMRPLNGITNIFITETACKKACVCILSSIVDHIFLKPITILNWS